MKIQLRNLILLLRIQRLRLFFPTLQKTFILTLKHQKMFFVSFIQIPRVFLKYTHAQLYCIKPNSKILETIPIPIVIFKKQKKKKKKSILN